MAGASLLLLIDDIASVLDDVATMTKVAARKTDLSSLNQAAADPQGIAAQATGAAPALAAPPQYSELGQVFANVLAPFSNYVSARNNSAGTPFSYRMSSSGKVIN